jgi:Flp pilus assembly protein CpaB
MSSRRILLAVAVGVAALLVVGLWLRRDRAGAPSSEQSPERAHQGIRVADVAVVSPDLDVGLVEIRGTVHPDYTDWSCILECREAEGCRADVRLMIE